MPSSMSHPGSQHTQTELRRGNFRIPTHGKREYPLWVVSNSFLSPLHLLASGRASLVPLTAIPIRRFKESRKQLTSGPLMGELPCSQNIVINGVGCIANFVLVFLPLSARLLRRFCRRRTLSTRISCNKARGDFRCTMRGVIQVQPCCHGLAQATAMSCGLLFEINSRVQNRNFV